MNEPILINTGPTERGAHRLMTLQRCPQLWAYSHKLNLQLMPRAPLIRGTLLHVGLAHAYARLRAQQRGEDPAAYCAPLTAVEMVANREGAPADMVRVVKEALEVYVREVAHEKIGILGVEEPADVTIPCGTHPEGHRYTARIDLVYADASGRVYLCDHKSTSRIDGKSVTRYSLSLQILGLQYLGARLYGARFGGVKINLVQVTAPYKHLRVSPDPAPHALARFPGTVCDTEERIASLAERDPWQYPITADDQVCVGPYGPCSALALCQWGKAGLP